MTAVAASTCTCCTASDRTTTSHRPPRRRRIPRSITKTTVIIAAIALLSLLIRRSAASGSAVGRRAGTSFASSSSSSFTAFSSHRKRNSCLFGNAFFRRHTAATTTKTMSASISPVAASFSPRRDAHGAGGGADEAAVASPSATTTGGLSPPVARRDETRHVLAGELPVDHPSYYYPDNDDNDNHANDGDATKKERKPLARQSDSSPHALLSPPRPIPDPYGWMRDDTRTSTEVLDHLKSENEYSQQLTSHLSDFRDELYEEMLKGIKETDHTLPTPDGEWLYYSRLDEGKSYKRLCRAPFTENWAELASQWDGTIDSPVLPGETTYLDVNALAEGKPYCATGQVKYSPSHSKVAYTVDFSGDEVCQLYVRDMLTGEVLDHDATLDCYGQVQWGPDDTTLYYLKMDETKRPNRLYRRTLSSDVEDELLYREDDELYWVSLAKSFDDKYIFVTSRSKETSEVHYLDLTDPSATLQCVAKRRAKVLYVARHRDDHWYITSNVGGTPNFRLMVSPAVPNSEELWKDVVDSRTGEALFDGGYDRSIDGLTSFEHHAVATGREGGLPRVWIITYHQPDSDTGSDVVGGSDASTVVTDFVRLDFDETAYDVGLGPNANRTADHVVLSYDSLVTPLRHLKVPLDQPTDLNARKVLKQKEFPGYNREEYGCERTTVKSRDGNVDIPVSLVYRKDVMDKAQAAGETVPVHLYGYGSYGACIEASFRSTRRSLLDRGVVYVLAHVRGGGEMGRQWYEEPMGGKYLCKKNTFDDFVDVARYLIDERQLTAPSKLSCEGRSAGGLLIGAAINQAPELFKVAVLGVPFVDVVCTMIDATIPLTVAEWVEWGNPNEEKFLDYMMEYSPINNVKEGATYPSCLLTGGLHDPRVQYWEPAKHAAELRHRQGPDSGPVCLKIDMAAGHFSASDRYKYLKELAFDYAFLLDQLGLVDAK